MKYTFVLAVLGSLSACAVSNVIPAGDLPVLTQADQARRFAAWQNALEHSLDEQTTSWSASARVRGSIAPIETVSSTTDGWCRTYEEVIADGAKRYHLVGIACRKPGSGWLVLDVRPFTETG